MKKRRGVIGVGTCSTISQPASEHRSTVGPSPRYWVEHKLRNITATTAVNGYHLIISPADKAKPKKIIRIKKNEQPLFPGTLAVAHWKASGHFTSAFLLPPAP